MSIFKLSGSRASAHKYFIIYKQQSSFAQKPYPVKVESSSQNKQQICTDFWKNWIKLSVFWYEGTEQKNTLTFLTTILRKLSSISHLDKGRSIWPPYNERILSCTRKSCRGVMKKDARSDCSRGGTGNSFCHMQKELIP